MPNVRAIREWVKLYRNKNKDLDLQGRMPPQYWQYLKEEGAQHAGYPKEMKRQFGPPIRSGQVVSEHPVGERDPRKDPRKLPPQFWTGSGRKFTEDVARWLSKYEQGKPEGTRRTPWPQSITDVPYSAVKYPFGKHTPEEEQDYRRQMEEFLQGEQGEQPEDIPDDEPPFLF